MMNNNHMPYVCKQLLDDELLVSKEVKTLARYMV